MRIRDLLRELFGIATVGVAAFLLLAVVSFDASDLASYTAPRGPLQNAAGSLGVTVASFLIRWVGGLGALGTGCWLLHFGWTCLRRVLGNDENAPPPVEPLRRITAGVVVVLVLAVVEAPLAERGWGPLARGPHPGGARGLALIPTRPCRRNGKAGTPRSAMR